MRRITLRAARWLLLACALAAGPALSQTDDTVHAEPLRPGETISLDGRLAHPAWARARVWTRFIEKDPVNGGPPAQPTELRVLIGPQALYVAVTALDSTPERIRDVPVRRDGVNRTQDFIVVYIDAIGHRESAQFFRVNAAGSTGDGMHTAADDNEDFSPDFDWDAAVARHEKGWTAVLRLPLSSLRYADGAKQNWRIMVARRTPREQFHLSASVPVPRDAPSFIATMQPLAGISLPEHRQFLSLRPGLTLRRSSEREAGSPTVRRSDAEASLDVKWRPRAELVIDGTLNPDFSQVELDVPQLAGNSQFALYFPEKRPFFFESADLLRMPSDALYTRSFTAPRAGLRATWRGNHLSGTTLMVDDRGGGFVLLPGPFGTGFAPQPASRTLAARVRHDEGGLLLGGLLAARRYAGGVGDNLVLGADAGMPLPAQWRLRGQVMASHSTAIEDNGTLQRGPARDGHYAIARLNRGTETGETALTLVDAGANFRHDSGFVNQTGVRKLVLFQNHGWFGVGPFNEFFLTFEGGHVEDRATGRGVKQWLRPGLWSSAARNLNWVVEAYPLSRLRTGPNAPWLEERYLHMGLVMTPAPWWPLVDTWFDVGRLADTVDNVVRRGARLQFSAKLRPLRPLELEPYVSAAWLDGGQATAYRESTAQLLGVWHLDARQNLRAILQRSSFHRAGGSDGGRNASLTYTFRHSAGSVLYLGYSRQRNGQPVQRRGDEAFVKLQVDGELLRSLW